MNPRGLAALAVAGALGCGDSDPSASGLDREPPEVFPGIPFERPTKPVPPSRIVRLEAEDLGGPWDEQANLLGYSGYGFRVSNADGVARSKLSGEVELPPGTYDVFTRAYVDATDRSFEVVVQGQTFGPSHGPGSEPGRFRWQRVGTLDSSGGLHTIALRDHGAGYETPDAILFAEPGLDPNAQSAAMFPVDPREAGLELQLGVDERTAALLETRTRPATLSAWQTSGDALHAAIWDRMAFDRFDRSWPLRARRTGVTSFDGYRVEKLLFESIPGLEVSTLLFVPDGEGPFPGVVSVLGHFGGKSSPASTMRAHALAKLGFIVVTFDPFGMEERWHSGNSHWLQPLWQLTGPSNVTIHVWEAIRALDLLRTRPELAPELPIALTGFSLGGLTSLYAGALESNFGIVVPGGYASGFEALLEARFGHDPCTYVFGIVEEGGMMGLSSLIAPAPQLLVGGVDDPLFPWEGMKAVEAHARGIYELYGAAEALDAASGDHGHEYSQSLRERMYGFVRGHLLEGRDIGPVNEPPIEFPERMRVTATGRVSGATTLEDLAQDWAIEALDLLGPADEQPDEFWAGRARVLGGMADFGATLDPPTPIFTAAGLIVDRRIAHVERSRLTTFVHDAGPAAPVVVLVLDGTHDLGQSMDAAANAGFSVVALRVRMGGDAQLAYPDWYAPSLELTGLALPKAQALEIRAVWQAIASTLPDLSPQAYLLPQSRRVALAALLAQASDTPFAGLALAGLRSSFTDVFDGVGRREAFVPHALRHADIAHLLWAASRRPLRFTPLTDTWQDLPTSASALESRMLITEDDSFETRLSWLEKLAFDPPDD